MDIAVVTGATGTIGRAVARRLCVRGDILVIGTSRRLERLADVAPANFIPQALDVCSGDGLRELVERVGDARVALVVNAVGSDLGHSSVGANVFGVWESLVGLDIDLKVHGLLHLVSALEGCLASGAVVVGVGGNLGLEPLGDTGGVGVADAALSNLVRQMSKSVTAAQYSIHVVAPGPVRSPRIDRMIEVAEQREVDAGRHFDRAAMETGLRLVDADDIAWFIETLYVGRAARMNGATVLIDNGARAGLP